MSRLEKIHDPCEKANMSVVTVCNIPIVWVMGCSGSGKSTQCQRIIKKYGFTPFSMLLNAKIDKEIELKTSLGRKYQTMRNDGKEVALAEVLPILAREILNKRVIKGFVFDGYPRDTSESNLMELHIGPPSLIISLTLSQKTLEQRKFHDKPEDLKIALTLYQKESKPILEQYSNKTIQIDGSRDRNVVFNEIWPSMDTMLKNHAASIVLQIGN